MLPTPVIDATKTRIITVSSEASGSGTREDWSELETSALKSWDRKGKKPLRLLPDDTRLLSSVESKLFSSACYRANSRSISRRAYSYEPPELFSRPHKCPDHSRFGRLHNRSIVRSHSGTIRDTRDFPPRNSHQTRYNNHQICQIRFPSFLPLRTASSAERT